MNIKLVKMGYEYKDQLTEMIDEWKADIEINNTNQSPWVIFKNDISDFDKYLEGLDVDEEINGYAPYSTFFCIDEDRNRLVGAVNIRHYLNSNNCITGGHKAFQDDIREQITICGGSCYGIVVGAFANCRCVN